MNCQEAQSLVEDALDRRLAGGAKRRFDLHLMRCASCRALVAAEQREHIRWFRALNEPEQDSRNLPPDFADRLVSAVADMPRRRPFFLRIPRWVRIAASLAIVASLTAFGSWAVLDATDENDVADNGPNGVSFPSAEVPIVQDDGSAPSEPQRPDRTFGPAGEDSSRETIPIEETTTMKPALAAAAAAVGSAVLSTTPLQASADDPYVTSGSTERTCASTAWDAAGEFALDTRIQTRESDIPPEVFESRTASCGFGTPLAKFRTDEPCGYTIIIR